jgi:hypothetical protein
MKRLQLGTTDGIWCCERDGSEARRIALAGKAVTHILDGGRGRAHATDGRQIWWSEDGWSTTESCRLPGGVPITVLAMSPHPPYPLFAGSIPAALFRSDEGGETWYGVTGFDRTPGHETWTFPGASPRPRVNGIAFDAEQPDTLFVSVEVGGIMRSLDGGGTWAGITDQVNRDAHFLAAHPMVSGVLYASMGFGDQQPGGVYRSVDYGATWRYCFEHLAPSYTRAIMLDPRGEDTLYVAATPRQPPFWALPEGPSAVLWSGRRGGEEWTISYTCAAQSEPESSRLITALALDPEVRDTIYLATSDTTQALHAIGALGCPPGGPFPAPTTEPSANAPAIAQARFVLQNRLAQLDAGQRSGGNGTIRHLVAAGAPRRISSDIPTTLVMIWV